jgi:hypothetical protein
MVNDHPLPWNKVRHALGHSITDAKGGLVAEAMTEAEADAILAVTNKVPALVEAADVFATEMRDPGTTFGDRTSLDRPQSDKLNLGSLRTLRTALAAFKTP